MHPPKKIQRGDCSATLPNRSGRYQGTTPTTWLNFYTPCKSQLQNAWPVSPTIHSNLKWCSCAVPNRACPDMTYPDVSGPHGSRQISGASSRIVMSTSVVYFHFKVSNVNKVTNCYGIVLILPVCCSF